MLDWLFRHTYTSAPYGLIAGRSEHRRERQRLEQSRPSCAINGNRSDETSSGFAVPAERCVVISNGPIRWTVPPLCATLGRTNGALVKSESQPGRVTPPSCDRSTAPKRSSFCERVNRGRSPLEFGHFLLAAGELE